LLDESVELAGRAEEALASAERAASPGSVGSLGFEAYALRLLGDIASHRGSPAAADEHYRRALALARELGRRPLVARCHPGWACSAGTPATRGGPVST